MLEESLLEEAILRTLQKSATEIPEDVKRAFESCIQKEESELAKLHLRKFLESINFAATKRIPVCPDTGWPIFFVKLGNHVTIRGGYSVLKKAFKEAVKKATELGFLRITMVDPISRKSSVNNVGNYIPYVEYKPSSADYIEITAVTKGGGSELFILQPIRILLLADGIVGIKKFIIDSAISGLIDGKTCPPNVLGIGIGGTTDLCIRLAKQAAVLRPIGDRHPEPRIARLEKDIFNALNSLGIGPMGCGGKFAVFDVHIEYAYTHTAGTVIGVNMQCALCRRATVRIYDDGTIEDRKLPSWFEGERNERS
jgi:fumarate hydratase subunit alpha